MSVIHLGPPNRSNATGRHYKSGAFEEKKLIRAGTAVFNGIAVANKNGSKVYIFICDLAAATTPTLASTIVPPIPVAATDGFATLDDMYGIPVANGLVVAASSTINVYTALGANDVYYAVDYSVDTTSPTTDA